MILPPVLNNWFLGTGSTTSEGVTLAELEQALTNWHNANTPNVNVTQIKGNDADKVHSVVNL